MLAEGRIKFAIVGPGGAPPIYYMSKVIFIPMTASPIQSLILDELYFLNKFQANTRPGREPDQPCSGKLMLVCFASVVDYRLAVAHLPRVSNNYNSNGCHPGHKALTCMTLGHESLARTTRNGVR